MSDPEWFPATLIDDNRTLLFGRITRDKLAGEAFLDQRMADAVSEWQSVPLSEVVAAAPPMPKQLPVFIFHSAFCCSTLLARALDAPGHTLSLKEPDVLMGAANVARTTANPNDAAAVTQTLIALLARRFNAEETILIKPTNAANNLLAGAVSLGAPTLILYGELRPFLVSVIKKGEACKAFMRTLYNIFALDPGALSTIPARQAMTFTDLQVAALVWRHQLQRFQTEIGKNNEIGSMNFESFVESPATAMIAVADHLGLLQSADELRAVADGPVLQKNSKFTEQSYDTEQRAADAAALEAQWGEEIDRIVDWERDLDLGPKLSLPLPNPIKIRN